MQNSLKILVVTLMSVVMGACSCSSDDAEEHRTLDKARLSAILRPEPLRPNEFDYVRFDSMPPGGRKMHINYLGATLGRVFNDSNHVHAEAARHIGIKPLESARTAWHASRPLVKVESNANMFVDRLTHSLPYLVPEAATLLDDIGAAFRDSLESRGGGAYRIKVTSVLRTPKTVSALRRRNVNAVQTSTHLYGTTFDISYAKFICDDDSIVRTQEDLKNLLGEVLNDLRNAGRCCVKYEKRQACFHITAKDAKQRK